MSDLTKIEAELRERSSGQCELCTTQPGTSAHQVQPVREADAASSLLVCDNCASSIEGGDLQAKDWFCLQDSIWSEIPAVQVVTWRMLNRLGSESWAQDLLEQVYMEDDMMDWAKAGLQEASGAESAGAVTKDSNGTELLEGDSVTLIKALDVKGGGFTAKRGTLVKGIRLTDDPENVEGRVNGMVLVLKTCFLKKA
ncbi:MAG: PhnA domain-containing protein [Planctomycetes bacterium]|nr:PhnA domain-containing protein [Planctomycetota bacterium]